MGDLSVRVVGREEARRDRGLAELLASATRAGSDHALSEHKRVELFGAGRHELVALLASAGSSLVGYAQLGAVRDGWGLEVVTDPTGRHGDALFTALVREALAQGARRGGGTVRLWRSSPTAAEDRAVRQLGGRPERDLLQMRVPLPLGDEVRARSAAVSVRPFRPGVDDRSWLEVNNRAFADHPEQGAWDAATLAARQAEPWFDPAGFLVLEEGDELIGSCWTKVHRDTEPPMGEIYVISVDPAHQGRGLGRALTVAGLDWLASAGLRTGMLFVDGANAAAVSLYRSLGFDVHHVDRSYVFGGGGDPTPAGPAPSAP